MYWLIFFLRTLLLVKQNYSIICSNKKLLVMLLKFSYQANMKTSVTNWKETYSPSPTRSLTWHGCGSHDILKNQWLTNQNFHATTQPCQTYCKVTSSRPIYYSILNSFCQMSRYIRIRTSVVWKSLNVLLTETVYCQWLFGI